MLTDLRTDDPATIGPYELRGRLGSGGMGHVYLGFADDGTAVAVKVPRADVADDPDFRSRFASEVAAARKVSGPGVASVLAADPDGDPPWLASQYIVGTTLEDAVRKRPLHDDETVILARGLAQALAAVHSAGVVHRDLKPGNVLLTATGPVIVDFGIALAGTSRFTQTGQIVGTPGWVAPERLQGHDATARADVWAWGACVAFAAAGRSAFRADTAEATSARVLAGHADLPMLTEPLRSLVAQALEADPARRPTAPEIARRLAPSGPSGTLVDRRSLTSAHPSTLAEASPSPRRWPALLAGSALLGALAVGLAIWFSMKPDAASSAPPTSPANTATTRAAASPTTTMPGSTLYAKLLRTSFSSSDPLVRPLSVKPFTYADGGPAGLIGAVEVQLEDTDIDEHASIQYDVMERPLNARAFVEERRSNVIKYYDQPPVDAGEIAPGAFCTTDDGFCVAAVGPVAVEVMLTREFGDDTLPGSLEHALPVLDAAVEHLKRLGIGKVG